MDEKEILEKYHNATTEEEKTELVRLHYELRKENRLKNIIEYFQNLKPFINDDDIPSVPVVSKDIYYEIIIPNLIRCGAIPKDKLEKNKVYLGSCRNASEAKWDGENFIYKRYKFGTTFDDDVPHFEDGAEIETDVFVPIKELKK